MKERKRSLEELKGKSDIPCYNRKAFKMISIRDFKPGDEKELSEMSRSCIVTLNSKDMEKHEVDATYEYFSPERFLEESGKARVIVAELDGEIAGTATLDGDVVRAVFVSPSTHGKGVGSALMKYIEEAAKAAGVTKLVLRSSPYAEGFYKKLGYVAVNEIHNEVGRLIVMEKEI
jgi:GNAT superfamily N-acetyltransferase